jgi:hypothetical protein
VTPYSVAEARAIQRDAELAQAIDDWRASTGPQHARDRRWAMALLAAERARRDLRRAEVAAAVNRNAMRRIAA